MVNREEKDIILVIKLVVCCYAAAVFKDQKLKNYNHNNVQFKFFFGKKDH